LVVGERMVAGDGGEQAGGDFGVIVRADVAVNGENRGGEGLSFDGWFDGAAGALGNVDGRLVGFTTERDGLERDAVVKRGASRSHGRIGEETRRRREAGEDGGYQSASESEP